MKPGVHEEMMSLGSLSFVSCRKPQRDSSSPSRSVGRLPTEHHRRLHRCKQQLQPLHVPRSSPTKPFVTGVPINVAGHHKRRRRCCSGIVLLPSRGMRETQQSHRRKSSPAMSVAIRASTGVTQTSRSSR